jgi:hypothetical protein
MIFIWNNIRRLQKVDAEVRWPKSNTNRIIFALDFRYYRKGFPTLKKNIAPLGAPE